MEAFIVLVVAVWILSMLLGKPLHKLAGTIGALLGGALLFAARLLGGVIAWLVQTVMIIVLIMLVYRIYRSIRRRSRYDRYNDRWPPMPPL